MDRWVVIPTYNERENIAPLVESIKQTDGDLGIIIVDDNSPDGTGYVAEELARTYPCVVVVHRPGKLGLGTAYTAGFRRALEEGARVVLTMDADFSHNPAYIPRLLEASARYDLVIGSRYVDGGGVRNWGVERKLLSWWANTVARVALGLDVHDCTGGFRCYRREVLLRVRPETIKADGYSYLIEMLFRCRQAGFTVGEVPIIFEDRRRGRSKVSSAEIFKAGFTVLRLSAERLGMRRRTPRRE